MQNNKSIAIYHHLNKGGALVYVQNITQELKKLGYDVTTYRPIIRNNDSKNKIINLLKVIKYDIYDLVIENYQIAKKIQKLNPTYTLVFPSNYTQAPSILFFLNKKTTFYIFTESKREYYEPTSFNYSNYKKRLFRLFSQPIKWIDFLTTLHTKNIIPISSYSQHILFTIYKKCSPIILKPGIREIKPKYISKTNTSTFLSIGILSKLKGHHYSATILNNSQLKHKFTFYVVGNKTLESNILFDILQKFNFIKVLPNLTNKQISNLIIKSSTYLSNQENEPFGLATLEAINNRIMILGKNDAGISEIVKSGLSGFLYPNNLKLATKFITFYGNQNKNNYYQTCIMDWKYTAINLLQILSHK